VVEVVEGFKGGDHKSAMGMLYEGGSVVGVDSRVRYGA